MDQVELIAQSQIPWERRREIGRIRAYWRTVWQVTIRPGRFASQVDGPVSYRDARLFQLLTVALLFIPLCGMALYLHTQIGGDKLVLYLLEEIPSPKLWFWSLVDPWAAGIGWWGMVPLCLVLLLPATTGAGSYWFHPRGLDIGRANRAVAISYYAVAPLAWLVLAVAMVGLDFCRTKSNCLVVPFETLTAGEILMWVSLIAWWSGYWRMMKQATHASLLRTLSMTMGLPMLWGALGIITLGLLPWAIGMVWLMVVNLN